MSFTTGILAVIIFAILVAAPLIGNILRSRNKALGRDTLMGAPRASIGTPVGTRPKPSLLTATGIATEMQGEIEELLAGGRKIEAIKRLRERSGLGLKEAKEAVEIYARVSGLG